MKTIIKKTINTAKYLAWLIFSPYKFKTIKPEKINKVLIVNLGFIGDLLATTPLIHALHNHNKKTDILIRKSMKSVLDKNPNINEILTYDKETFHKIKNKYDLAILIHPPSYQMSKLLKNAKIPYRISYNAYFLTRKLFPILKDKHKLIENLSLAKPLRISTKEPKMEIYLTLNEKKKVEQLIKKNKLKDFAILHPGKRTTANKGYLWSTDKFANIADYLVEKHKLKVLICGSKEDSKIAKEIINKAKNKKQIQDFTSKTTIREYAELLANSKLLVSIDTAAIHLASISNTKTIALFCCYPKVWHPWQNKQNYELIFNKDVMNISTIKVKNTIDRILYG